MSPYHFLITYQLTLYFFKLNVYHTAKLNASYCFFP